MNKEIYQEIKRRILFMEYRPRERLNEKKIADEFKVSRTPIREVLLRLEWERLVNIIPRGGITVTNIDFELLRDVYHSRVVIDGGIGRLAAKNITDEQLARMKTLADICRNIQGDNGRHKIIDIDIKFREVLFEAAGSPSLRDISNYLYHQTLRVWYLTFDKTDLATEVAVEVEEIENTIAVLSRRDPDQAEQFRRQVIVNYLDRIHKYFSTY